MSFNSFLQLNIINHYYFVQTWKSSIGDLKVTSCHQPVSCVDITLKNNNGTKVIINQKMETNWNSNLSNNYHQFIEITLVWDMIKLGMILIV